MKVRHAVIMAAGTSSRFAPLSYEKPKALLEVRGEILIERQIEQLMLAGVPSIVVVTGYKAEMLDYLKDKYPVRLIHNADYRTRNNHGSLYAARDWLYESYICSADNYFAVNPFEEDVPSAYYAVVYAEGETDEWCVRTNKSGVITGVTVGGHDAWVMMGHAYFDQLFADQFVKILENEYDDAATRSLFWEDIYLNHIDALTMKARQYGAGVIAEFDSIDELRVFDPSYVANTRSPIIRRIAASLGCSESDIRGMSPLKDDTGDVIGFQFTALDGGYAYRYRDAAILPVGEARGL